HQRSASADKQAVDRTDRSRDLGPGRHSWLVPYRVYGGCACTNGTRLSGGLHLHSGRPALPCVTFRDAALKLTSSAPSVAPLSPSRRPPRCRADIVVRRRHRCTCIRIAQFRNDDCIGFASDRHRIIGRGRVIDRTPTRTEGGDGTLLPRAREKFPLSYSHIRGSARVDLLNLKAAKTPMCGHPQPHSPGWT
ncbi:hypothetical protein X777_07330, partial [Ooceraea biroi]